jgi:hypothetical protein
MATVLQVAVWRDYGGRFPAECSGRLDCWWVVFVGCRIRVRKVTRGIE